MKAFGRESLSKALDAYQLIWVPPLPGRTNHIESAVLVPIVFTPSPSIFVTLRPSTLREHAGEFCFPGGRRETSDSSLEATALREAEEELSLRQVEILGALSSVPLYTSDYRLFPFVGQIDPEEIKPAPEEVASVHRLDLLEIFSRQHIDAVSYERDGLPRLSPVFLVDGRPLYGATAYVLYELLQLVSSLVDAPVPPRVTGRFTLSDLIRGTSGSPA